MESAPLLHCHISCLSAYTLHVYLLQKYESLLVHIQYVLSCFSRVQLFMTPWTVDHQAPVSMEFSRQVYQELNTLMSPALAGGFFTTSATWDNTS